ncbi:MAG TPA: TRAP transporter small permease [Burkholderiales bacterium]|nr:TRAP transporter small permease [Burkholderiales bacterium]
MSRLLDRWLLRPLAWLGAALVFAMMALTFVDVVGRYLFNAPVSGSAEATELMLAVIVFAGLPLAAAAREHIQIDLLEHLLSDRARRIQALFGFSIAAVVTAFVAWRLALRALELGRFHDLSSHLGLPVAWLAWFMVVGCMATVIAFAALAWRAARS